MTARASLVVALAWLVLLPMQAQAATLHGIAVDQAFNADPLPADLPGTVPTIVRLLLDEARFRGQSAGGAFARLEDVLAQYQARHIQVILALGQFPAVDTEVETWRETIRAIAERSRGQVAGYQVGEVQPGDAPDVNRYVYLLKLAAVQIQSVDAGSLVIQGSVSAFDTSWQARVLAAGTAPYVDGVALAGPSPDDDAAFRAAVQGMVALVEREKPTVTILLGPIRLPADPGDASSRLVDAVVRTLATSVRVTAFTADGASLRAAFAAATRLTDLLDSDLVTLDEGPTSLRILRGSSDVTATTPHRLIYSLTRYETYLTVWATPGGARLDVEIEIANATTVMVRDPITALAQPPARIEKSAQGRGLRLSFPATGRPLIVDFNFGNTSLGTQVDVRKETLPRVEEIIFRYQRAQAAQDATVQNYVAHVRIEQHFHPTPADPAYNLITENRLFSDRSGVEWEELSFELNGARWAANRPAFPLVQPEKVLSLPLDLRLNQDYGYRLDGVDVIGGRPAFVVRFDPINSARALYRGIMWVDRQTFVRLKVQAVETHLSGSVVSNDETQVFAPAGEVLGRPVWLLNRLSSKQIFLIAGRNVLIEREVHLSDISVNAPDFEDQRSAARASNRIMYRDTDAGVRYLVKRGETREVSEQLTTSARAIALGTNIDPSFDYPLPIGGINILDFNFLNRNLQLALLYGGVIALGNIQHANLWGGKFDASVDFFGLAVKANDDVFSSQGRLTNERVNHIPLSTGFNLGFQATPFHKISGHYELRYDAYFRDALTAPDFVIPSNTATNGEGFGYEYRRRGYSLTANATAYQRVTWNPWGAGNDFDPADQTYTKYDIGLSKDFTFATFHTIHVNAAYFGGQRLDRFSMYQFGLFDPTRVRGVPSAVRFSEIGMVRGSYSFNLFEQYRFDLFVDHATGRDPRLDAMWQQVTGTGIRLSLRAPRSTILQLDLGKSFLPANYNGAGSTVVQILLLKPL